MVPGDHDTHTPESTVDMPVNQVSLSYGKNCFEEMAKNFDFDLLRPFTRSKKAKKNMVPRSHVLHTLTWKYLWYSCKQSFRVMYVNLI